MGGKQKQTSETKIDPAILSRATSNFDDTKAFANTPATPYSGVLGTALNTGESQNTMRNLMNFSAPQVATQGNVSQEQINHYMDPYLNDVVGATQADMEHSRQIAQMNTKAKALAATGFGSGSRRYVQEGVVNGEYDRNMGSVLSALRSAGFKDAVGFGQQDLQRLLAADSTNQGAALSSAGIRANSAGSLASLIAQQSDNERANQGMNYAEFTRQQQEKLAKRGLLNSALGAMPVPQSTTQTSKSTPGIGDFLQAGATVASAFMSDERLKTDVREVGYDDAGRRWVDFRYLWDEPEVSRRGLMAQEVQKIEPWRVIETPSGYLAVDYAGLL